MKSTKTELALPPSTEMSGYRTQILSVQKAANELRIENEKDLTAAEVLLKQVSDGEKIITGRKEEITRPLMKALASGRDLFKPLELGFADAKKVIKSKMLGYQAEEEQRIAESTAKVEARVAKGTMRADTGANKLEALGSVPKMNTRTLVKVRVVDEFLVPREYLEVNMTKVTNAVLREGAVIPGIEKYEERVVAVR